MKRTMTLAIIAAGVLLMPLMASAQTASGTLAVTATVQSSINMVFNSDASGVPLAAGAGTSAATLNFGNISAYGTLSPNVGRSVGAANFTVSTPFDVQVSQYNGSSANYKLTAQLAALDGVNGWAVGGVAINGSSATQVTATGAYSASAPGNAYTLALTVPLSSPAGVISNTINFTATAN